MTTHEELANWLKREGDEMQANPEWASTAARLYEAAALIESQAKELERLTTLELHHGADLAALRRERDELWADFERYAQHEHACGIDGSEECTCGLTAARQRRSKP